MSKLQLLIQSAQQKGYRFECYSNIETRKSFFGFTLGKWVWFWFSILSFEERDEIYYDHAYSQNTGVTTRKRSYRERAIKNLEQGTTIEQHIFNSEDSLSRNM